VLVAEPAAAAVYLTNALGVRVAPGAAVVVYDFGAGTFDVAVVRRGGDSGWDLMACDGFDDLGGVELDAVIVERLRSQLTARDPRAWLPLADPRTPADARSRRVLWDEARAAKEQLSRSSTTGLHVPIYDADMHLTREEFEHAARPLIERTVALTASTLASSGLSPDRLAGLFLVGGSSRIPLIATLLHRRLGIAPTVIEQPELVVAQGALSAAPARSSVEAAAPVPVPDSPAPRTATPPPARPRRRRWVARAAAGATIAVAAAVIGYVVWPDREPEIPEIPLTDLGRRNESVFESDALAALARPWLNDVSACEQREPDTYGGTATEYVVCGGTHSGHPWQVQFRAMRDAVERDKSRLQRVDGYNGQRRGFTGEHPRSGQRIDYVYQGYPTIYWDDDDSAVVGDLTTVATAIITPATLAEIWQSHVT
jgi:hypothetical protein